MFILAMLYFWWQVIQYYYNCPSGGQSVGAVEAWARRSMFKWIDTVLFKIQFLQRCS